LFKGHLVAGIIFDELGKDAACLNNWLVLNMYFDTYTW